MDEFTQLIAFVLSVTVLVGFFVMVSRLGAVLTSTRNLETATRNLEAEAKQQTRYLCAISVNLVQMRNGANRNPSEKES